MRDQPHKPTGADIALLAGVSRSTVSRVVNGYPNVPEETRRRVQAVIDRYGYYPSLSGQALRGKRSRCIGVFMGDRGLQPQVQAAMLCAFSAAAQARGYLTLTSRLTLLDMAASERTVREVLCTGCVDAGVFFHAQGKLPIIRRLLREGQTIGALGYTPDTAEPRLYTANMDHTLAERVAAFGLSLGHRRFALVCDPCGHADIPAIFRYFQASMAPVAALSLYPPRADTGTPEAQAARAVDALGTPLMLLCADHASVFAAYCMAQARGLTVGADVSILGVGLLPPDLPVWPSLCCFRIDSAEMVTSLTQRLIDGLEGAQDVPRHAEIGYQFVPGESCGQALDWRGAAESLRDAVGSEAGSP